MFAPIPTLLVAAWAPADVVPQSDGSRGGSRVHLELLQSKSQASSPARAGLPEEAFSSMEVGERRSLDDRPGTNHDKGFRHRRLGQGEVHCSVVAVVPQDSQTTKT